MAPSEIAEALRQLEVELARIDAPILNNLKPGLPPDQIENLLREATTVDAHPDLVSWYSWKNGTTIPDQPEDGPPNIPDQQLVGYWLIMSLPQAVRFHNQWHAEVREEYGFPDWYPDGWFPILRDVNGGVICINTTGEGSLYIADVHMDLPSDPPEPQSPSLLHFVSTYIRLLQTGIVHIEPGGASNTVTDRKNLPADLTGRASYW